MQTLIVRVYRRSHTRPQEIAGMIETVGSDEKRAFQSFSGLITELRRTVLRGNDPIEHTAEHKTYAISDKEQTG